MQPDDHEPTSTPATTSALHVVRLSVTAGAAGEPRRPCDGLGERARAVLELVGERRRQVEIVLLVRARAIGAQRGLRQRGELVRELLGGGPRLAARHDAVDEADRQRLVGVDGAAGEDQVERARQADQARQADRRRRRSAARRSAGRTRRARRPPRRRAGRTTARARGRRRPRGPAIAAITGLPSSMRDGPIGPSPSGATRFGVPGAIALRSAPAQNVPWSPYSTPTRASSSASNARNASASASAVARSTAFLRPGRSRMTVVTGPNRSTRTIGRL